MPSIVSGSRASIAKRRRRACCTTSRIVPICVTRVACSVLGLVLWARQGYLLAAFQWSSPFTTEEIIVPDAILTLATDGFRSNMLSSGLRNVGGWKGPIYVLTDDPEADDANGVTTIDLRSHEPDVLLSQETDLHNERSDVDELDRIQRWTSMNEMHQFGLLSNETKKTLWSKWHKSQLFDLMTDATSLILFLDADIVVQTSLDDFWRDQQVNLRPPTQCDISMYREPWYANLPFSLRTNGSWNSGIFVARRSALPLLLEWGQRLLTPPFFRRDQPKLTEAIKESRNVSVCVLQNERRHVVMEAHLMEKVLRYLGKPDTTFLHFTTTKKYHDELWG